MPQGLIVFSVMERAQGKCLHVKRTVHLLWFGHQKIIQCYCATD